MALPLYHPRNILITGGAGFIGSNLILHLLRILPSAQIINLDKITYASTAIHVNDQRYAFVKGDICDAGLIEEVLTHYQIDTILHLAAESHVDRSIAEPAPFIMTNIVG